MLLSFEVTRQFQRGESKTIAKFSDENDAQEFMEAKAAWDHKTKVHSIYRLYQQEELIKEIDTAENETLGDSGKMASGQRFSPTPLSTSPKPAGSVPYRQEDSDDETDI